MCETLIVLLFAPDNMLDHAGAITPTAADQITCAKSLEQGFGLIKPGSICRSEQHVDTRLEALKELRGLIARMAGTVINNQVNAMGPTVGMKEALHGWTKVVTVILIQALSKHMPRMPGQARQQIDRTMSFIVKLHSFDLTRSHRLLRIHPFKNLQVGFLVGREQDFPALPQALDSFVIPENFESPRHSFIVPDGGLPETKKRQSQIGSIQDFAKGCVIDRVDIALLDRRFCQTTKRPVSRMPADACGFAARQSFNLPALTSGKKHAADPLEGHRIRRLVDRRCDSADKSAKWWRHSAQTFHSKSPPAALDPRVATKSALAAQSATVFHRLATACASRLYASVSTGIFRAFDHAWLLSCFQRMTNPTTFSQFQQGISCII